MHASDLNMLTPTEYPKRPKVSLTRDCTNRYHNDCTSGDIEYLPRESSGDDVINHPSHYCPGGFECIDAMVETQGVVAVMDFCICNAFKYLWRHGRKNGIEDVRKAIWYLNKYVELADKGNYPPTTNL